MEKDTKKLEYEYEQLAYTTKKGPATIMGTFGLAVMCGVASIVAALGIPNDPDMIPLTIAAVIATAGSAFLTARLDKDYGNNLANLQAIKKELEENRKEIEQNREGKLGR